jgi:hypothetical protein
MKEQDAVVGLPTVEQKAKIIMARYKQGYIRRGKVETVKYWFEPVLCKHVYKKVNEIPPDYDPAATLGSTYENPDYYIIKHDEICDLIESEEGEGKIESIAEYYDFIRVCF